MRRIEKPGGMSLKGSEAIQQPRRRLDSWKAIAAYVGRSEKTVRRWENSEVLPVHRLIHEKRNSVYAFTDELDAWWEVRAPAVESGPRGDATWIRRPPAETVPSSMGWATRRLRPLLVALLTMAILCLLALAAIRLPRIRDKGNRPPSEARIRSLAVLPLENLSGDPNQEFFTDGMTAELITEMAKIKSLRVISRSSAMRYKGSRKPLQTIAGELGVDAIVEGEVLQSQRRVRVTAQLIQAATDSHLWSETYERDLRNAVALQGEVAEAIARAIRVNVTPEEHAQLGGDRRVNAEAYEAYLKGRFFWSKRTEAGLEKSHLAISKDPNYALAYAALADSYQLSGVHEWSPRKDAYIKAKVAADKALELDSTLGEAHTVLAGVMYGRERNWQGAEKEFKRALELSPSYVTAYSRYALFLMRMGRVEESLEQFRRVQSLDPASPKMYAGFGWLLLSARRYDEAIQQLQKSLEMEPGFGLTHLYLGWAYEAKGLPEKAIPELRQATLSHRGTGELASLAHAYAVGGHLPQAQTFLNELKEQSKTRLCPTVRHRRCICRDGQQRSRV